MSNKTNLYIGRAGQMAVMAEFLLRGWNVAVPEVDIGDDLLVLRDEDGNLSRIQVKTASATALQQGYSLRYSVRFSQLSQFILPEVTFVFASRLNKQWNPFIVIPRDILFDSHRLHGVGSLTQSGNVTFYFRYDNSEITCGGQDFSHYLDNWDEWPIIEH
ncbi:MAG: hypothetical protein AAF639_05020 [Chloroflexota bacterium]